MKFHLDSNTVEGTPEELVKYQELLECKKQSDEAETYPTEIKVGDRVKVLRSEGGAVGEATVSAVLKDGDVELSGTNKNGAYSSKWSNNVRNLEKIGEATKGYTFWYIDGSVLNNRTVLKQALGDYFEDSKGSRYDYQTIRDMKGLIYPIDSKNIRKFFEDAKRRGNLLKYYPSVDGFVRE